MTTPNVGERYTYDHPEDLGFGEHHLGQPLTAEMTELDMKEGTEVTVLDFDENSGWPLAEWTDSTGIGRITTIDPDFFAANFSGPL